MRLGNWGQTRLSARGWRCLASCHALALALLVPAGPAAAADNETVNMFLGILTPGSIIKVADMDFGDIVQPNVASTVVMTASPTPTCTTTNGLIRSGVCRAAQFSILGRRNWRVRIRETSNGVVTLNGPAGATMTMTNITIGPVGLSTRPGGNGWNLGNYNIDNVSGMADFYLGGRLNVGAAQTPGVYNGTITIQIQFN